MTALGRTWSALSSPRSSSEVGRVAALNASANGMRLRGCRPALTLRDKAAALVRLAEGASFREASEFVRKRAGYAHRRGGALIASRDGRLARGWVSQYTPIMAERYLPRRWPRTLVLDKLPVHVRDTKSNTPKQSGHASFLVLAALSYVGKRKNRRAVLWRVGVSGKTDQVAWGAFFAQLDGEPTFITSDRDPAMLNAIAAAWPNAKAYPCAHHLRANIETILREGGLWDRRRLLCKVLTDRTFIDLAQYAQFRQVALRYLSSDLSKVEAKQHAAMVKLHRCLGVNEDAVVRWLVENHWPATVGGIERPLREMKNSIYDRRANLKNLERVGHLLLLAQLHQMMHADERQWAGLLRSNHLAHDANRRPGAAWMAPLSGRGRAEANARVLARPGQWRQQRSSCRRRDC